MRTALKKLEDEAMRLPLRSRARLVKRLIASLDGPAEPGVEDAWLDEARRRAQELAVGKVKAVSAAKVLRKAHSMVR